MTLRTEPLRDVEFLAEALLLLREGMFVSIAPPFTLLDALLDKLGWPSTQRLRHIPRDTLDTWSDLGFDLTPGLCRGLDYQTIPVAKNQGCVVRDDRLWPFAALDDLYEGLITCSALHATQSIAAQVISGATRLIQAHQPVIFVTLTDTGRRWPGDVVSALEPFGYSCFANREPLDLAAGAPHRSDGSAHIVALPSDLVALSGWSAADTEPHRKPLRGLIAGWQGAQRAVCSEIASWSCRMEASDLLVSGMHPIDYDRQPAVRWTGPSKNASLALFFPIAGTYRVSVEVCEYAFDDTLGLGQLRIGNSTKGSTIWSDFSRHRIEAVFDVPPPDVEVGAILTVITSGLGWRSLRGRWFSAGVALSGVTVARISES